jgi:ParB-like chromosome segregation protein Spo0J
MQVIEDDADLSGHEIVQREMVENRQRQDLKPSEEAAGIRLFLELTGLAQKEAAGKFGLSNAAVTEILAVLAVPEWIQQQIDTGAVPRSAARSLARVTDADEQAALANRLIDGSMTRDALIGTVRAGLTKSKTSAARKLARGKAVLSDGRSVIVSGQELTLETFIETIEAVLAKARRCRTRGVDLPKFLKALRSESKAVVAPA